MARNEGNSLAQRIFCCGCQGFWRKREASPPLQIQNQLKCFASSSQDGLEMQCQEDAASLHFSQGPTAGDHEQECLSEGHTADDKRSIGRSSSSVSATLKLKPKRGLTPLPSLPLQKGVNKSNTNSNSDKDTESYYGISPEALLTPPVINLIPPTPSNVIDDDQFFEVNSEEDSMTQTSGSECTESPGSPITGDAGSCRDDQDTVIRRTCGTYGNNASHIEGDTSVMSFGTTVKSDIYLLKDVIELNSDKASFQHELKSSWKLEGRIDSEAESNTLSQMNPVRNYQVAQIPRYQRKKNFNSGINLLQFTEQNLDDLNNKEANSREVMKAKLRLKPLHTELDSVLQVKRPATRMWSLGDVMTTAGDLQSLGLAPDTGTEGDDSPRQRRITVASYVPNSTDQNGNLKEMVDTKEPRDRSLEEMNTDEVCEWFRNLGLQKSIPFIKEAKLQGHQLAAIDLDILDLLQLTTAEEKENLLSSIYKKLHPMDTASQNFDRLLETIGPHDIERFTAALVTLSASQSPQSSDWVSHQSNHCHNREDKPLEEKRLKKSHLVNLSVKAFQHKLQLKVPRDSTVAKVIEACWKILGLKEDPSLLSLNIVTSRTGKVVEELQAEKQIGELKLLEKKDLKLQLCRKASDNFNRVEKEAPSYLKNGSSQSVQVPESGVAPASPHTHPQIGLQSYQMQLSAKDNEISELNQRIRSLSHTHQQFLELQRYFHSLHREAVDLITESVCPANPQEDLCNSESKLTEIELLIQHVTLAHKELDNESSIDKGVLEHMKLDYQILKERILTFHQKHQQARWRNLQEFQSTKANSNWQSVTLSQLIAPHSTAMLVTVQEAARPDGYGFTVSWSADHGLQIVAAENSHLQPNDRKHNSNELYVGVLHCRRCRLYDETLNRSPCLLPQTCGSEWYLRTGCFTGGADVITYNSECTNSGTEKPCSLHQRNLNSPNCTGTKYLLKPEKVLG